MKSPFPVFSRKDTKKPAAPAKRDRPCPEQPTYVVGDLHGRFDLLAPLIAKIDQHIREIEAGSPFLVFVGNYLDYGPGSFAVMKRLRELTEEFPDNVICLMGSHERMLLDFLDDPERRGSRWLKAGGGATLAEAGLKAPEEIGLSYSETAQALAHKMGTGRIDWLKSRPLSWHSGNLWVVHAAADPKYAMADQSARVLLWGHPEFDVMPRRDDVWIAHGHSPVDVPKEAGSRINVNTNAWQTGHLTAAAIQPIGEVNFLTTNVES